MPEFKAEELQEILGLQEPLESVEQIKSWAETVKGKEVVVEKPYQFSDEYIKGLVETYNQTGDIRPYVENNIDYSKLGAEDLIRRKIKQENEGLSEKAINVLVNKELEQFKISEETPEEEKTLRQELLGIKENKLRKEFTEQQKKFMAPEKPSVNIEKWKQSVNENPTTKGLVSNKKIPFGDGEETFNMEIDSPESLVEMAIDNTKFFEKIVDKDGKTNFDLWYKVAAYVSNPKAFEELLINHGKSIGTESVVREIKNQQLGKREIQGADAGDLLTAFKERGVHK